MDAVGKLGPCGRGRGRGLASARRHWPSGARRPRHTGRNLTTAENIIYVEHGTHSQGSKSEENRGMRYTNRIKCTSSGLVGKIFGGSRGPRGGYRRVCTDDSMSGVLHAAAERRRHAAQPLKFQTDWPIDQNGVRTATQFDKNRVSTNHIKKELFRKCEMNKTSTTEL